MIRKAIIPVAGLGTRFLPAAKAQPKEMLAVVDKPVIQYIVEEAVASGIQEIILVTAIGKRALEDHFDRNFELEYRLGQKKKYRELEELKKIGRLAKFAFVRQPKPLGDGHAALCALPFLDRHEPVAVLFGDDIIEGERPALADLIDTYERYGDGVIALEQIPKQDLSLYGIVGGTWIQPGVMEIQRFAEKPSAQKAPSRFAAVGRYILSPALMERLERQKPGPDGEIRLADLFMDALREGLPLYGRVLKGTRYDCGNKFGFLRAQIEFGLRHPETGKALKKFLREKMKRV